MKISLIVAYAENRVIGKDNDLIWHLPDDMKYFSHTTKGHYVIMGRKNWESIPAKYQPLPERTNVILTRNSDFTIDNSEVIVLHDLNKAIQLAEDNGEKEVFIIGGGEIYREGLSICHRMYITEVRGSPEGDTYFPEWNKSEWRETSRIHHTADERHQYSFDFVIYDRRG